LAFGSRLPRRPHFAPRFLDLEVHARRGQRFGQSGKLNLHFIERCFAPRKQRSRIRERKFRARAVSLKFCVQRLQRANLGAERNPFHFEQAASDVRFGVGLCVVV